MSLVNSTPGEYAPLRRDEIFPAAVVAKITDDFGLDKASLERALDDVIWSFNDAGHWQTHYPHWLAAKEKAAASLTPLRLLRRTWSKASSEVKATIAASVDNYSADAMLSQIDNLIAVMELLADTKGRGRGNPGGGRKSKGVELPSFAECVEDLYRYWCRAKKDQPLGHELQYNYLDEGDGEKDTFATAKSEGIQFIHACLSRLDSRIGLESCRTLLRAMKKRKRS